MKLFKSKNKRTKLNEKVQVEVGKNYIILDIGTEFVKVAVARVTEDNKVEIAGYDRTPQKSQAMKGAMVADIEEVVNTVDLAIGNAINKAEEISKGQFDLPTSVVIGIAGELIKGVTIEVNYEREDPEYNIDQAEIDDVLAQIKSQAFEEAKMEIAEDIGISVENILEINTDLNSTLIDGVRVNNPIGFTGEVVTYRIYSTFSPKIHIDALLEIVNRLNLDLVSMVVDPYAIAIGAKNAHEENFSGIFVDVGGGTTDIALVENGSIIGTNMFAFGGRVFTKRIGFEENLDYIAAENLKLDYSDKKTSKTKTSEVKAMVSKDIPIWLDGVSLSIAEFEDVDIYPSRIYICGGGAMLPDILEGMLEYPWLKTLPFNKFPKVTFLFPNQISDVVDLTRMVSDPRDVTPMALARMLLENT